MTTSTTKQADTRGQRDIVVFKVDEIVCGMDVLEIQEIKKIHTLTRVHRAPPYVRGLVNLRGQIITLIDVRDRLGLVPHSLEGKASAIVVAMHQELVGLLVDSVGDVIQASRDLVRPAPANLHGVQGHYFSGVLLTGEGLVALVNKDRIAGLDTNQFRDDGGGRENWREN